MKNREKFAKEIIDIACKGLEFAVTKSSKITYCSQISCKKCIFKSPKDSEKTCRIKRYEWSGSEYVEKPKYTITSREQKFLDTLVPDCKYIARDGNNRLYIYGKKPIREDKSESWIPDHSNYYCATRDIFGNMFDFIKWGDVEPWRIEDLKKLEVRE